MRRTTRLPNTPVPAVLENEIDRLERPTHDARAVNHFRHTLKLVHQWTATYRANVAMRGMGERETRQ